MSDQQAAPSDEGVAGDVRLACKADRLAVAGVIAPALRSSAVKAKKRRIAKVDKDGRVVGYTTLAEVQEALLLDKKIELEVSEGARPKEVLCELCGRVLKARAVGTLQKRCRQACGKCVDCGAPVSKNAVWKASVRRRDGNGLGLQCGSCAQRKIRAAQTPEQRSEIVRRAMAARTPEQRSEAARKGKAAWTSEQRSEAARKRSAGLTSEQRSEITRKAWETRRAKAAAK